MSQDLDKVESKSERTNIGRKTNINGGSSLVENADNDLGLQNKDDDQMSDNTDSALI